MYKISSTGIKRLAELEERWHGFVVNQEIKKIEERRRTPPQ